MRPSPTSVRRAVCVASIAATGVTAGMFAYGAFNVAPAFRTVPLDVRFSFHTALMARNRVIMQFTMATSIVSNSALAVILRGRARWEAAGAGALGLATFGITRLGNVPINRAIRNWSASSPPQNYVKSLTRWDIFNRLRTGASMAMFALTVVATNQTTA